MTSLIFRSLLSSVFLLQLAVPAQARVRPHIDIEGYYLANVLFEYSTSKTKDEFMKRFAAKWSPEDRDFVTEQLKNVTRLPKVTREGMLVTVHLDGAKLRIDMSQMRDRIAYFNDHKLVMRPHQPLRVQITRLLEKMKQSGEYGAFWHLLVPKAEAIPPLIIAAGVVIGTAVLNKLIDRYGNAVLDSIDYNVCRIGIESAGLDWKEASNCKRYIEAQKAKAKENPELLAAKTSVPEKTSESPIDTASERCPHEASGADKDKVYSSTFFLIKEGKRVRVKATLEDKKIDKIEILDFETGNLVGTYKVNAENVLDEIEVPNPKAGNSENGKLAAATLKIKAGEKVDDPEIASLQTLHQRIYAHFGLRLGACKALKVAEDAITAKKKKATEDRTRSPSGGRR